MGSLYCHDEPTRGHRSPEDTLTYSEGPPKDGDGENHLKMEGTKNRLGGEPEGQVSRRGCERAEQFNWGNGSP